MPLAVIFFTDRTNIRADIFILPGSLPMYQEIAKASFMRATASPGAAHFLSCRQTDSAHGASLFPASQIQLIKFR